MSDRNADMDETLVIVRGGGDIASGTIARLFLCGFNVLVLETEQPTAIRRSVSFSEAVFDGKTTVEGVTAERISSFLDCFAVWGRRNVPILIDPQCSVLDELTPFVLIDAILAKKNCGIMKDMAELTIGLGPGFVAGEDVDIVIETSRGHDLGRVITRGPASINTGIPGVIAGVSRERVIHAPCTGVLSIVKDIGTLVEKGEPIAQVDGTPVTATISGLVRGMIRDQFSVTKGLKIADIDPRTKEYGNCFTISDKARCISGGVLEAILSERIVDV